jgi:hypothetical protein
MRHAGKRTVGTVAIGLLIAMLIAAVFGAAILASPHAGARTSAAASHSTNLGAAVHPTPGAATASVTMVTKPGAYTVLPFNLELQITITGSSITTNTSLWVTVTDNTTGAYCTTGSLNQTLKGGFSFYNLSLNPVSMGGAAFTNCPFIESDPVILNATVYTDNNITGTPSKAKDSATAITSLVYNALNVNLLTPTVAVGAGNITLIAIYQAQYVQSVRMLIFNSAGTNVYNGSLQWTSPTSPALGAWFEATPGVYPFKLTISTPYGSFTRADNITVLAPGGGTVYSNTSTWQNASIFPGLSGAASGTILLVVGLIVGMIVALVVGRSLMRPAPVPPAQQWQPGQTAPANTCSVCGKSFATPEELKEHAKSEHGITS